MTGFAKKIIYAFSIIIIASAILVAVVRSLTPVLDSHRAEAEQWASVTLGVPVQIKSIRLFWYKYYPEIRLNDVTAKNKDTTQPILQVRRISIFISILKSLWHWKLVPSSVMLSGTDLNLLETQEGKFVLQGYAIFDSAQAQPLQTQANVTDVMGWLSQQPNIILNKINIHYEASNHKKWFLTLTHLGLENNISSHVVSGSAILNQAVPVNLTTAIQWTGNPADLNSIIAKGYLNLSNLSLSQWLADRSFDGWIIKDGVASAKIWIDWQAGAFQKIQSMINTVNVKLQSPEAQSIHIIKRMSGNIGWKSENNKWIFAGDNILIDMPSHLWPLTNFYVSLNQVVPGQFSPEIINIGYVNFNDIKPFVYSVINLIPDKLKRGIDQLDVGGDLERLTLYFPVNWTDWKQLNISFDFYHLHLAPWAGLPGIANLSGSLKWDGSQAKIELDTERAGLSYHEIFSNQINIDKLTGDLTLHEVDQSNWQLDINGLHVLNDDINANIAGSFIIKQSGAPNVDLTADFTMARARHVSYYLPLKIFNSDLQAWLSQAFLGGEATDGKATLKGNLADFPFDKGNGTFFISAHANNAEMQFAPDWPIISHVNADLVFSGSKIAVNVQKGETGGIPFGHADAVIPDLGADIVRLFITADPVETDFKNAVMYIYNSPLQKIVGNLFHELGLSGPMQVRLSLNIPLLNPDRSSISGDIVLDHDTMELQSWSLPIDDLTGNVHFTENTTTADQIQASLFKKPLSFSLKTIKQANASNNIIQTDFSTAISTTDITTWLMLSDVTAIQGTTDIHGQLNLAFNQPVDLHVSSQLVGLQIDLPAPYAKQASTPIDFTTDITVEENMPLKAKLTYGNLIGAAILAERDNEGRLKLNAVALNLGGTTPDWPKSKGLYLTGEFDHLTEADIKEQLDKTSPSLLPPDFLKSISVKIKKLDIMSQAITNATVAIQPDENNWLVDIEADQVSGNLNVPRQLSRSSSIIANFDKLQLVTSGKNSNKSIDPNELPAIEIKANNAVVNQSKLGNAYLKLSPTNGGLTVNVFRVTSPVVNFKATGSWIKNRHGDLSALSGQLTSGNFHALLMNLGVDARNFIVQNGTLNFNLSWESPFYDPAFAKMNGNASLNLGEGRVLDVGDENSAQMGLGRMLSLFSLQTIPRRISLDFSDLVQKGYSFDYVKGDFVIDDGDIRTKNMRFDGPVAKIEIGGRIGLQAHDFNLVLSVTPYVTSSIPVAATILTGNPLIGLGVLAVNTVVGSQVSKVTTHYYTVTGPWHNPVWTATSSH